MASFWLTPAPGHFLPLRKGRETFLLISWTHRTASDTAVTTPNHRFIFKERGVQTGQGVQFTLPVKGFRAQAGSERTKKETILRWKKKVKGDLDPCLGGQAERPPQEGTEWLRWC